MLFSHSDVDEVAVVVVTGGGDDDDYADDDGSSRQLIVARFEKASPLSLRWTPSRRGVTGGTRSKGPN